MKKQVKIDYKKVADKIIARVEKIFGAKALDIFALEGVGAEIRFRLGPVTNMIDFQSEVGFQARVNKVNSNVKGNGLYIDVQLF